MRARVRPAFVGCLALLLLLLSVPAVEANAVRDTVTIGVGQEPECLMMAVCRTIAGYAVAQSVFLGMVQIDDKWRHTPRLVEKVPQTADGDWVLLPDGRMRVTYKFRRGYTWHDGRPVTALDAVFTHMMLRNPLSPTISRFILNRIDHMYVPNPADPYTLVVQWNERYPFANLGHWVFPRHILERDYARDPSTLVAHKQARAPIGNGPYRFVEWQAGSHISLEANEQFLEGRPRIKRQVWRFVLDTASLQSHVLANQVDVTEASGFSVEQAMQIEQRNLAQRVLYTPGLGVAWVYFNLENEWLKDKRIRHAIAYAVDRQEIATRFFLGKQTVLHSWLPERHEAYNANIRRFPYDPGRARALLAEAGLLVGTDGILRDARGQRFELTIMAVAGSGLTEQIQLVMKEQLRQVGIDLRVDNKPTNVMFSQLRRRQYQMMMIGDFLAPTTLPSWLHSSQIPTAANNWGGANTVAWAHAENDKLVEQVSQEVDRSKRTELFKRHQEIFAEELPFLPMYSRVYLNTAHRKLMNVRSTAIGTVPISWNSEAWAWSE